MKGTNIGELEELVLLVVANLFDNAYGIAVKQEIEDITFLKLIFSKTLDYTSSNMLMIRRKICILEDLGT